jgi:hypothetical protein
MTKIFKQFQEKVTKDYKAYEKTTLSLSKEQIYSISEKTALYFNVYSQFLQDETLEINLGEHILNAIEKINNTEINFLDLVYETFISVDCLTFTTWENSTELIKETLYQYKEDNQL